MNHERPFIGRSGHFSSVHIEVILPLLKVIRHNDHKLIHHTKLTPKVRGSMDVIIVLDLSGLLYRS
jgi:hypothetical protein